MSYYDTGLAYGVRRQAEPRDTIEEDFLSGWRALDPKVEVRSLVEDGFDLPKASRLPGRERNEWSGPIVQADGSIRRERHVEQAAVGKPFGRPPMGEMDRDFLGMDLSVVQYLADEVDEIVEFLNGEDAPGRRRISEFHDLIGQMEPIRNDPRTKPAIKWGRTMTEDGEWVDAYWTRQQLAERWGRYQWNDDYFEPKPKKPGQAARRPTPWGSRVGWVHRGNYVYLGESVFTTLVVKSLDHTEQRSTRSGRTYLQPVWKYTVFWRESMGNEPTMIRGRLIPITQWVYHYSKTFANLGGTNMFDREGATAFADRLQAKAKLEADLIADTRRSMGQWVPETWDRDEFPYEPALLDALRYGAFDTE